MRITIFGSGYVGLVTGACLADAGNQVICVDVDDRKIAMLKAGEVPTMSPASMPWLNAIPRWGDCASPPMPGRAWPTASFN